MCALRELHHLVVAGPCLSLSNLGQSVSNHCMQAEQWRHWRRPRTPGTLGAGQPRPYPDVPSPHTPTAHALSPMCRLARPTSPGHASGAFAPAQDPRTPAPPPAPYLVHSRVDAHVQGGTNMPPLRQSLAHNTVRNPGTPARVPCPHTAHVRTCLLAKSLSHDAVQRPSHVQA